MAVKLTIDFETRSAAVLRECGAAAYAAHPSTEILCLALKPHGEEPRIWFPPAIRAQIESLLPLGQGPSPSQVVDDEGVRALVESADIIEAHNAQFEFFVWKYVMAARHGFAPLDIAKLRCSAAKAVVSGLPRDLDGACQKACVPQLKDRDGARLMQRLCRPAPVRTGSVVTGYAWRGTPDEFARLALYCMQDVRAEEALSDSLPELLPEERELWLLDLRINDRGVRIDLPSVRAVLAAVEEHSRRCEAEFRELTGLDSARQRQAVVERLRELGQDMEGLTRQDVEKALAEPVSDEARRILELRQTQAKSSVAKYRAMLSAACPDGRVRGALMFYGADTGRWSGRLIQPQNFPRGSWSHEAVECIIDTFRCDGLDGVAMLYGDPMAAASGCLRGMLVPSEGEDYVCADFSGIEGRVLAWLAGDRSALGVYKSGRDPYKTAASAIFGVPYEQVDKSQRQVGKVAELALGYQGGVNAFRAMAAGYGVSLSDTEMKGIVDSWRASRPITTGLWRKLEDAAMDAVKHTGRVVEVGRLRLGVRRGRLCMRLPSGRCLCYMNPRIGREQTPWGERTLVVVEGVDSVTRQWKARYLYGGLLAENATQAVARDILREALFNLDVAGYEVVMHVHDEVVAEIPEGRGSVGEVEALMCRQPSWADGLPLKAEGWRGKRYRK